MMRIIICLRKSEVTIERISVCNVIENLMEHGINCLPCSYTSGIIGLLPWQLRRHIDFEVIHRMSFCHSTKHKSWLFPSCSYGSRGAWHTV